jgi:hypothetical protein
MQNDNTVTLGKRKLQVITSGPVRHDVWLMSQVKAAGIEHVDMKPGEAAEDLVDAMLDRVMRSGHALDLLGSMLAPADMNLAEWRETTAREMAEFIGGLTEKEDKAVVRGLLARCLAGFFASGLASVRISSTSSGEPDLSAGGGHAAPTPAASTGA